MEKISQTRKIEVIIPQEKAVFRLDGRGRWCNVNGVFRNRKISAYFHSAIRHDAHGYFVCQEHDNLIEKVYFPYEDTALFVVDVILEPAVTLILNTGRRVLLDPGRLSVADDSLYMAAGEERIKFGERALLKIADILDVSEDGYFIQVCGVRHRIPDSAGEPS